MLKKRLIPKLLIKKLDYGGKIYPVQVSSIQFKKYRIVGDPVSQAKIFEAQLADELIVLMIDKKEKKNELYENKNLINRLAAETFMPLTIGGGVRSINDFEFLLTNGADKVSVNNIAINNPNLITKFANRYGSQSVVVSIDFFEKNQNIYIKDHQKKKNVKIDLAKFLKYVENYGAGEVIMTDISRDGMNKGLNIKISKLASEILSIPLIISGGCGLASHFSDCFTNSKVEAVASGNYFAFRDQNPLQTRSHIKNAGVNIRI